MSRPVSRVVPWIVAACAITFGLFLFVQESVTASAPDISFAEVAPTYGSNALYAFDTSDAVILSTTAFWGAVIAIGGIVLLSYLVGRLRGHRSVTAPLD